MTLIPTTDGSTYHVTPSGDYWRAFQFIEGATSYDVLTTHDQAYEVARAFGKFQTMLADLPDPPLHETIPKFHDGPERFRAFLDALERDPLNRAADAGPEIAFLVDNAGTFDRLPALVSSGALPLRATHNDCKSNNVLIDNATGEGICVIDLDTLMPGLVLYDFGDMVRTSTCPVPEDSQILEDVQMDLERFTYLTHGYLASAGEFLTSAEKEQLVFAGKVITLTIGARFLTDHLMGDTYFKTHRPDHNLDRCRVQFALVRSIVSQESAMHAVVERAVTGQGSERSSAHRRPFMRHRASARKFVVRCRLATGINGLHSADSSRRVPSPGLEGDSTWAGRTPFFGCCSGCSACISSRSGSCTSSFPKVCPDRWSGCTT